MFAGNLQAAADTLKFEAVVQHSEKEFEFYEVFEHIKNSRSIELPLSYEIHLPHFPPVDILGYTIDLSPTKHSFFLVLCGVLLTIVAVYTALSYKKRIVPKGFASLMEIMVLFIRDEIILPNMGKDGLRYAPYLLTTFFYILFMNLAGLVPYGSTATSNIMVTGGLAIIAFFMIQISAIRSQGLGHYLAHLTGGAPWFLWPIMIPSEILGLFTKPFALCMRLFANMTGGHMVIISLLGLILMFRSIFVAPLPILFVIGIYMLELFVAFLQAYVFTMLTALFMGVGIQAGKSNESH